MADVAFLDDFRIKTLTGRLRDYGVRTLPKEWVLAHKERVLREHRAGVPRLRLYAAIICVRALDHAWLSSLVIAVTVAVASGFLGHYFGSSHFPIEVFIGSGIVVAILVWAIALCLLPPVSLSWITNEFLALGNYWQRIPYRNFQRFSNIPGPLLKRATRAERLYGAQVYVEQFGRDPLLVVVQKSGWSKTEQYIGAWDTGDPRLDHR